MGFIADNVNADPKIQNFNRGGIYLEEGTYRVHITKAELKNISDGAGRAYIIEFTIIASNNPLRPAGMGVSQFISFQTVPKAAFRDMALFMAAAMGHADDVLWMQANLSPAVQERLACEGNVIGSLGLDMLVVATTRPQKHDKSKVFTTHTWASASNPQPLETVLRMPLGAAAPAQSALPLPPPPPAVFPPAGWTAHPAAPGYYYKGQDVLTEAQLRALR